MITLGELTQMRRRFIHDRCTGKKPFKSFKEAEHQIDNLTRKNAHRPELGIIEPYNCDNCGRVHIGHRR